VNQTIARLTAQLLASYENLGAINHLDGKNLPSKRAVCEVTMDLLRLLLPGFFDETLALSAHLENDTTVLVIRTLRRLETEIRRSLDHHLPECYSGTDAPTLAHHLAVKLLEALPAIREILQTDIDAAYTGDPAALSREEVIVSYPFVEAIAVQRIAHQLYLDQVPLVPRIMTEWAHARTGMDLHPGARIGSHFFVDHCTGTVVGETSVIGNHVKMYQGVGLVARSLAAGQALRGQRRHPTLEDRVTVYAGATIIGGDTVVGAGSTIGASVFLLHSVPPYSLVTQEDANVKVVEKRSILEPGAIDFQI